MLILLVAVFVAAPAFAQKTALAVAQQKMLESAKSTVSSGISPEKIRVLGTMGAEAVQQFQQCVNEQRKFEQDVATQENNSFIMQNILINMADPMENISNEQALPLALCYANYKVKGQSLVSFVRAHANIFPGDVSKREETKLRVFAGRVEALNEMMSFNEMAEQDNEYFIAQNILINLADPFAKLNDQDAAPKAGVYVDFKVKGEPMLSFAERQAIQYDEFEGLRAFANRVAALAK